MVNKIATFRQLKGFTQKQMAIKLGISESYYCQLENTKRRMSLEMALKIAAVLEKTPDEIFLPQNFSSCKVDSK